MLEVCRECGIGATHNIARYVDVSHEVEDAMDAVDRKVMATYRCDRDGVFFMLVAKCPFVARLCGARQGDLVCMEKGRHDLDVEGAFGQAAV
jgi:uncharacterized protein with ATP-grasp and redox domains